MLQLVASVRLPPGTIVLRADADPTKWQAFGALAVIFFLARYSNAGADSGIESAAILTLISSAIMAALSYALIFFDTGDSENAARKWAAYFLWMWFFCLCAAFIIDGIPSLARWGTPTHGMIKMVGGEALSSNTVQWIRAIFFGTLAGVMALYRTALIDPAQRLRSPDVLASLALGIAVGAVLLRLLVFANFI